MVLGVSLRICRESVLHIKVNLLMPIWEANTYIAFCLFQETQGKEKGDIIQMEKKNGSTSQEQLKN